MYRCPLAQILFVCAFAFAIGCAVGDIKIQMAQDGPDSGGSDLPTPVLDARVVLDAYYPDLAVQSAPLDAPSAPMDARSAPLDAENRDAEQCGNGICGIGETQDNCCSDCGCRSSAVCDQRACIVPIGLAAGGSHSCLLLDDGTALCWGGDSFGELGNGSTSGTPTPTRVVALSGATLIAAGGTFTCALLAEQTVKCWGDNSAGQLGNGSKTNSTVPVSVSNLTGVTSISAGYDYACAVVSGGGAKCWGNNSAGQLGDGSTSQSSLPVDVKALTGVAGIASGFNSTCARLADGSARCWGDNTYGQLGNGTGANSIAPTPVLSLTSVVGIAAYYTATPLFVSDNQEGSFCAVLADGSVKCWGSNALSELGTTGLSQARPITVQSVAGASQVVGGKSFACALASGAVACWGYNGSGQLGSVTSANTSMVALPVSGLGAATAIAAGSMHACALLSDASVYCWGDNIYNELGNDAMTSSAVPVSVFR